MPTKYYLKELPEAPIYVRGAPVKFDFLETSDPAMISELDIAIVRGVGGIVSITQEQYQDEKKKQDSLSPSGRNSSRPHGRLELSGLHAQRVAEAIGRGDTFLNGANGTFAARQHDKNTLPVSGRPMPDPIQVPSPSEFSGVFMKPPPTAKASEIAAATKG